MLITRPILIVAAACMLTAACKSPRPARERAGGDLTGRWTAESVAVGPPVDTGRVRWQLEVEQREGGKLSGRGSMASGAGSEAFTLSGLRGEGEVQWEFDLRGRRARFHGGVTDARTMVGEVYLPGDTLPITFSRR